MVLEKAHVILTGPEFVRLSELLRDYSEGAIKVEGLAKELLRIIAPDGEKVKERRRKTSN